MLLRALRTDIALATPTSQCLSGICSCLPQSQDVLNSIVAVRCRRRPSDAAGGGPGAAPLPVREAFSEGLTEAAALNNAQRAPYQMDVGGAPFHTRTEVLHRHEGMLSAMASDDFSQDVEGGGCSFLDRDPTWFPLVLHFMRTGATPPPL